MSTPLSLITAHPTVLTSGINVCSFSLVNLLSMCVLCFAMFPSSCESLFLSSEVKTELRQLRSLSYCHISFTIPSNVREALTSALSQCGGLVPLGNKADTAERTEEFEMIWE